MMIASAHLRQAVLDQLYELLKDPLTYGNRTLLNIVNAPRDGLVSLKLVYDMTNLLKPYPLEYVEYCIPRDLQQRFRWSSDFTRMGLKENAQYYETNALGFMEEDLDNVDTSIPQQVQPVIYDGGKFYIDDEHTRSQRPSSKHFFEYDKVDIQPIGRLRSVIMHGPTCYNCGKSGHHFRKCPQPIDYNRIKRQTDRLFENAKKDSMEPGKLSQQLKEALDMSVDDEPPYYSRMRYYGYPPGYLSYFSESKNADVPLLKVYDGKYVIHTKDQGHGDQTQSISTYSVEYPGLYGDTQQQPETESCNSMSYTAEQTQSIQQQWDEYYYNQYQYYYHYYTSEPQPPGVECTANTSNTQVSLAETLMKNTTDSNTLASNEGQSVDMEISSGDEG